MPAPTCVASGLPYRMLSPMLPASSPGSWGTRPTACRQGRGQGVASLPGACTGLAGQPRSAAWPAPAWHQTAAPTWPLSQLPSSCSTGVPSSSTWPCCALRRRRRSMASVDLPLPLGPTKATFSPAATCRHANHKEPAQWCVVGWARQRLLLAVDTSHVHLAVRSEPPPLPPPLPFSVPTHLEGHALEGPGRCLAVPEPHIPQLHIPNHAGRDDGTCSDRHSSTPTCGACRALPAARIPTAQQPCTVKPARSAAQLPHLVRSAAPGPLCAGSRPGGLPPPWPWTPRLQ
jgi:hypothetical protein